MKEYSGQSTKCEKCDHGSTFTKDRAIHTRYCKEIGYATFCSIDGAGGEHLHRTCTNCSYEWLEKCMGKENEEYPPLLK